MCLSLKEERRNSDKVRYCWDIDHHRDDWSWYKSFCCLCWHSADHPQRPGVLPESRIPSCTNNIWSSITEYTPMFEAHLRNQGVISIIDIGVYHCHILGPETESNVPFHTYCWMPKRPESPSSPVVVLLSNVSLPIYLVPGSITVSLHRECEQINDCLHWAGKDGHLWEGGLKKSKAYQIPGLLTTPPDKKGSLQSLGLYTHVLCSHEVGAWSLSVSEFTDWVQSGISRGAGCWFLSSFRLDAHRSPSNASYPTHIEDILRFLKRLKFNVTASNDIRPVRGGNHRKWSSLSLPAFAIFLPEVVIVVIVIENLQ